MKCKKCGAEIESGNVYCPNCGESIQLVPNYDVLEEELLSRVVEDKDKSKDDRFATGVYKPVVKPAPAKTQSESKSSASSGSTNCISRNKSFISKLLCFLVIVVFGMLVIIPYVGSHSYDSVMNKAVEAETNKQYAKALGYFEEAYNSDKDSFEAIYGMGRMFYRVKEYDNAVEYLLMARDIEPDNKMIYTYLLQTYEALGDTASIYELYEKAAGMDYIQELFVDYLMQSPTFSLPGGNYEEDLSITLTADEDCQIFYTVNGKNPTTSGKLYSKPIKLTEGTTEVRAVAMNNGGDYSEVVSETYIISPVKLSRPSVSPDGGTFTSETMITISVPNDCKAYYTWDGSDPATIGVEYTGPFPVIKGSSILSVVVKDKKGNLSPVYHGEFNYTP